MVTLKWEVIKEAGADKEGWTSRSIPGTSGNIYRAKVFGGWLVRDAGTVSKGIALTFVPDPSHRWK